MTHAFIQFIDMGRKHVMYTKQIMSLVYVIIVLNPQDPAWNMFTICEMNGKHAA